MKSLSDEEIQQLIDEIDCFGFSEKTYVKLKTILNRGRKAIEFVEALIKHRDNGVDLEAEGRIYNWIDEYQQLCKEEK